MDWIAEGRRLQSMTYGAKLQAVAPFPSRWNIGVPAHSFDWSPAEMALVKAGMDMGLRVLPYGHGAPDVSPEVAHYAGATAMIRERAILIRPERAFLATVDATAQQNFLITGFHELAHSSMTATGRRMLGLPGPAEEVVAEMAAAMVAEQLWEDKPPLQWSRHYIMHWWTNGAHVPWGLLVKEADAAAYWQFTAVSVALKQEGIING